MGADEINQVSYALGELRSAVESLDRSVQTSCDQQREVNEKMDRRLSKVEAKQHWYSGAAAACGAVFGIFVGRH